MGVLLLYLISSFFTYFSTSQHIVNVSVHPDSHLTINGSSNINTFTCEYKKTLQDATVIVTQFDELTYYLKNAMLTIEVEQFDCGHRPLTEDFQETLQSKEYPFLNLKVISIKKLKNSEAYSAEIMIQLAGIIHHYTIPVAVSIHNNDIVCIGEKELKMTDFEIAPPVKFMGMIKVNEEISISFQLILEGVLS